MFAVAFRHFWSPDWRSSFIYSAMEVDNNTTLTGTGVTSSANSEQVNLLHSPIPTLTLGVGLLAANREVESGAHGSLIRLTGTAKSAL